MWNYISLTSLCNTPGRVVKTVQQWVPDDLGNLEANYSISTPFHKNFMSGCFFFIHV